MRLRAVYVGLRGVLGRLPMGAQEVWEGGQAEASGRWSSTSLRVALELR